MPAREWTAMVGSPRPDAHPAASHSPSSTGWRENDREAHGLE